MQKIPKQKFRRMKKLYIHTFKFFIIASAVSLFGCANTKKINSDQVTDAASIKNMIEAKNFMFVAQYVNPLAARRRDVSGAYDVTVNKDTVVSYLPYFGRSYTALVSPSDADFDFTSTKFSYTITTARKGWNVSIKPRDQTYLQELYFTIFDNGAASLNVTSINRSSLSYDGYITERKTANKQKK